MALLENRLHCDINPLYKYFRAKVVYRILRKATEEC